MSSPFDDDELAPLLASTVNGDEDDTDDDLDWEEVHVPEEEAEQEPAPLRIVLRTDNEEPVKKKSNAMSHAERKLRIDCHKIHTVLLLMNARIRNKWLNDELLHARLLSLTPLALQNAFAMIHSSRVPDAALRGRMFENAVTQLAEWWSQEFFQVTTEGHIRNNTFDIMKASLGTLVPGFTEQFELVVSPPEIQTDNRFKTSRPYKPKPRPKETQKIDLNTPSLIDATDIDLLEDILDNSLEPIKSPKSLMKHALMQSGSRDTSAQLFTALCRALAIPTRLIVSLQSVPWKAAVGREAKKYPRKAKGKGKEKEVLEDVESAPSVDSRFSGAGPAQRPDGTPVEKSEKAKGKEKAKPPIKLRKSKSKGNVLGSANTPTTPKKRKHDDPCFSAPTFWTEVFSKPDSRWIPVDPIRGFVNKRHVFDPSQTSSSSMASSGDNRLVYVLAFEEDSYARDVTRRYAREFAAKVAKVQGGSTANSKARVQWWEHVLGLVTRPFRLNRDDIEDDELETAQLMEGMPTSITGFKEHPLYVLTRHLKQHETIHPPPAPASASSTSHFRGVGSFTPELGKFRGEPVYPRSAVVSLKTPENWLRSEGRRIREGEVPMKHIKLRASTVGRRREVEILKEGMREAQEQQTNEVGEGNDDGEAGVIGIHVDELDAGGVAGGAGGEVMQGLYARHQTELYVPDPVVDGIVPKNQFGNIDLYVKTMLPKGAVHLPFRGISKIARKLQIDFAEAVIGFEFRKRKATPVLEGIVVAAENEEVLIAAFLEAEQEAEEKARLKKEERVLKQWSRLVHGLRIRERLQKQYADRADPDGAGGPSSSSKKKKKVNNDVTSHTTRKNGEQPLSVEDSNVNKVDDHGDRTSQGIHTGAGFLVEAGDVVHHYQLPKVPKLDDDLVEHPNTAGSSRPSRPSRIHNKSKSGVHADPAATGDGGGIPLPDFETYDIDMVPMDREGLNDSPLGTGTTTPSLAAPKTMQELADDAARALALASDSDIAEIQDPEPDNHSPSKIKVAASGSGSGSQPTRNKRGVSAAATATIVSASAQGGMTRSTRSGRSELEKETQTKTIHLNGAKMPPASTRRQSTRKRKGRDDEDKETKPSPTKRGRRGKAVEAGTPSVSTRVLRPRKSKVQMDEGQETEED